MGLRWMYVLALCLGTSSAGFAGEQSGVLRRISCPVVRYYVAQYSASAAEQWARGKGASDVVAALERNKKFLRAELAHRVNLKFAPDIRFRADERFDEAERIEKILRTPEVRRDLDKPADEDT